MVNKYHHNVKANKTMAEQNVQMAKNKTRAYTEARKRGESVLSSARTYQDIHKLSGTGGPISDAERKVIMARQKNRKK